MELCTGILVFVTGITLDTGKTGVISQWPLHNHILFFFYFLFFFFAARNETDDSKKIKDSHIVVFFVVVAIDIVVFITCSAYLLIRMYCSVCSDQ